ncbi:hypothetical protein NMY22_g5256 [Coprinellus aureogranulatus]|nr:hypothetical protein NMY22_g5256 [Coprinellus aureogranulatus]
MPIGIISTFRRLQELRMTYVNTRRLPLAQAGSQPNFLVPPWRLTSLHYRPLGRIQSPLLASPRVEPQIYSALVHLSLEIEQHEVHAFTISRVLPACQNSPLQTLRLYYGGRFDPESRSGIEHTVVQGILEDPVSSRLSLPGLGSLRYLSIGVRSSRTRDDPPKHPWAMPRGQVEFFSSLIGKAAQPALEALDFVFSWGTQCVIEALHDSDPFVPGALWDNSLKLVGPSPLWERTDSILASRVLFPQLRAIRMAAHLEDEIRTSVYEMFRSTDYPELARVLQEQVLAVLPQATWGRRLLVDAGSKETRRRFDDVANPVINGAWSYTPLPYIYKLEI